MKNHQYLSVIYFAIVLVMFTQSTPLQSTLEGASVSKKKMKKRMGGVVGKDFKRQRTKKGTRKYVDRSLTAASRQPSSRMNNDSLNQGNNKNVERNLHYYGYESDRVEEFYYYGHGKGKGGKSGKGYDYGKGYKYGSGKGKGYYYHGGHGKGKGSKCGGCPYGPVYYYPVHYPVILPSDGDGPYDEVRVTEPTEPPAVEKCNGRPHAFKFKFTGGMCGDIGNQQTYWCTDRKKINTWARIIVADKDFEHYFFDDKVERGFQFSFEDMVCKFPDYLAVKIIVRGYIAQVLKFDVSCTQPLFLGDGFGAIQVVGWKNNEQRYGEMTYTDL